MVLMNGNSLMGKFLQYYEFILINLSLKSLYQGEENNSERERCQRIRIIERKSYGIRSALLHGQ